MKTKLIPYRAGFTNVYFLIENGNILLIDTGSRKLETRILKFITSRGYRPEDLKLIFLTHTHYDHAGSVAALKKLTGAKIIVHESEANYLVEGFTSIPKGTNPLFRFISKMGKMKRVEPRIAWYEQTRADILFQENLSLNDFGFNAEIFHSPGHTIGSSSLISGENVFVGDDIFNLRGNFYPGFADDEEALRETWKKFSELDVKWFYPAHGKRISKDKWLKYAFRKNLL